MNSHMMAAVLYGKEHLQVEPVAVPTIESGDILVRVKVALTCGTDVKVFRRGYHAQMIVPPAVFGHELEHSGGYTPEDATGIAKTLLPDILSYDPRQPVSFPNNGRALTDDVADVFFSMYANRNVTDMVGPHRDLLDEFPYLGPPHSIESNSHTK